jgi:hypothetical protein
MIMSLTIMGMILLFYIFLFFFEFKIFFERNPYILQKLCINLTTLNAFRDSIV